MYSDRPIVAGCTTYKTRPLILVLYQSGYELQNQANRLNNSFSCKSLGLHIAKSRSDLWRQTVQGQKNKKRAYYVSVPGLHVRIPAPAP
jgi:hypothetical protein